MPPLKPGTILPTDAEDKTITRHAREDDTLLNDEQLAQMKPVSAFPELAGLAKRGRPYKTNPKLSTTVRLDAEVIEFFKSQGKGWQTRLNAALLEHVREHQS